MPKAIAPKSPRMETCTSYPSIQQYRRRLYLFQTCSDFGSQSSTSDARGDLTDRLRKCGMKRFSVSLDISSPSLTLGEISAIVGCTPSSSSHNKGDRRPSPDASERVWEEAVWRLESRLRNTDSLARHLEDLIAQCAPMSLSPPGSLLKDCTILVNIAVFFDTVNVSLSISLEEQKIISAYGASLSISCYPCELGTIH